MLYRNLNLVLANVASQEALRNHSSANLSSEERSTRSRNRIDKTMQKIADSEARNEIAKARIEACLKQISEVKATMTRYERSDWLIGSPQSSLQTFYEPPVPELKTDSNSEFKKMSISGIRQLNSVSRLDQATHQDYVYKQPIQRCVDG